MLSFTGVCHVTQQRYISHDVSFHLLRGGQADFGERVAHARAKLEKCTGSLFSLWSGRAGRFLQHHQRVGYTTESYVGVARGGATGVNGLTGCGRKPFGTAG